MTVELLVIGGGTAGIVAAKTAARLGASVILVERERTGGDCLWTGCVPSKALIAAAAAAHSQRSAGRFGVAAVSPEVDFAAVLGHVRRAIARIEPVDSPEALAAEGVTVLHGDAVFDGPRSVLVGARRYRFQHALIATGSAPILPEIPGLSGVLSTDTIWELGALPNRLLVLGGGPAGCELAQAFSRLGSRVTIVERAPRLLPQADPAAAAALAHAFTAEGIEVHAADAVLDARTDAALTRARLRSGRTLHCDAVLAAIGRRPRVEGLDLAAAGVRTGDTGQVLVDSRMRTSNRRIYAAGDVTGAMPLTHVAGVQGSVAASNAVLLPVRRMRYETVPRVTFTDPEVAEVGIDERAARERHGSAVRVRELAHDHVDRAVTEAATAGVTRVVLDGGGRVLGACVVAPRAGEMVAELAGLLARRAKLRSLSGVLHAYPTWADGVWNAALAEARDSLRQPGIRRVVAVIRRLRRAVHR